MFLNRGIGFATTHIVVEGVDSAMATLEADGFTVPVGTQANADGWTTHYMALELSEFEGSVGAFTTDGEFSQAISGLGFRPVVVLLHATAGGPGQTGSTYFSTAAMPPGSSLNFLLSNYFPSAITSLDDDGFSVGENMNSTPASVVPYLALPAHNQIALGVYAGTQESFLLPTVTSPSFALSKRSEAGTSTSAAAIWLRGLGNDCLFEAAEGAGDLFWGSSDPVGISVGADTRVNLLDMDYAWFAFLDAE